MKTTNTFTPEELEAKADMIMNDFDFDQVLEHMQNTNHTWLCGDKMEVPDLINIKSTARYLLTTAIYNKNECTNVGTGGFMAYKLPWGLQLTFQLSNTGR